MVRGWHKESAHSSEQFLRPKGVNEVQPRLSIPVENLYSNTCHAELSDDVAEAKAIRYKRENPLEATADSSPKSSRKPERFFSKTADTMRKYNEASKEALTDATPLQTIAIKTGAPLILTGLPLLVVPNLSLLFAFLGASLELNIVLTFFTSGVPYLVAGAGASLLMPSSLRKHTLSLVWDIIVVNGLGGLVSEFGRDMKRGTWADKWLFKEGKNKNKD